MDALNAMADVCTAASRAWAVVSRQEIDFSADRTQAITELCDHAEAHLATFRDIVTGSSLDDTTLATFLDDNENLL